MSCAMTPKERIRAIEQGTAVDRVPVQPIIMTFAARYAGILYGKYVQDCRELAKAQLAVLRDFDLDVVTLCSDPCREAADCGAAIRYFPDQPPSPEPGEPLLKDPTRLATLRQPDPRGGGRMHDRVKGVELLAAEVGADVPVLGWIEGPIAEAADLRGIRNIMYDVVLEQDFIRDLFAFVIEMEVNFARAQIEAGADWIGIGDAIASKVDPATYENLVVPAERELIRRVKALGAKARLHVCGKINHLLPGMATVGADMIDIDSPTDMAIAREYLGGDVMLLGNISPVDVCLNGTPEDVIAQIETCAEKVGAKYIVGAGCEPPPHTPPENMHAMVRAGAIIAQKRR
jgi:MtaA/CmuA family methyltransferase